MEEIIHLDQQVFQVINGQWHHPLLDIIMPFVSEKANWIPLYLIIIMWAVIRFRKVAIGFILFAVLSAGVSDLVSSKVFKPAVQRIRPCRDTSLAFDVRVIDHCGSGYSFTSSHATNHFALAVFFALTVGFYYAWARLFFVLWAAIISYSRVYLGVHYPLDVFAGGLIGAVLGGGCAWLYAKMLRNAILPFSFFKKSIPLNKIEQ